MVAALRLRAVALCFLTVVSWKAILDCIVLDTVRTPRAAPISPDRAALKAVLVRVRMLVASSARKVAVSSRRFFQVIIFSKYLDFWLVQIFAVGE